jgi:hypothetical protein
VTAEEEQEKQYEIYRTLKWLKLNM